jgi:hypothetical protein
MKWLFITLWFFNMHLTAGLNLANDAFTVKSEAFVTQKSCEQARASARGKHNGPLGTTMVSSVPCFSEQALVAYDRSLNEKIKEGANDGR